jgi:alpha-tubulin suppressor-like RCC1 family protein
MKNFMFLLLFTIAYSYSLITHSSNVTIHATERETWFINDKNELFITNKSGQLVISNSIINNNNFTYYTDKHIAYLDDLGCVYIGKSNDTLENSLKLEFPNNEKIIALAAGTRSIAMLDSNKQVWYLNLDNNTTNQAIKLDIIKKRKIIAIAVGKNHSISLKTFGDDEIFMLEDNGSVNRFNIKNNFFQNIKLSNNNKIAKISASFRHVVFLDEKGYVYTFGEGCFGQLGHGDQKDKYYPTKIDNIDPVIDIATGIYRTVLLTEHGEIYTFGEGHYGQLAHGYCESLLSPKKIDGFCLFWSPQVHKFYSEEFKKKVETFLLINKKQQKHLQIPRFIMYEIIKIIARSK